MHRLPPLAGRPGFFLNQAVRSPTERGSTLIATATASCSSSWSSRYRRLFAVSIVVASAMFVCCCAIAAVAHAGSPSEQNAVIDAYASNHDLSLDAATVAVQRAERTNAGVSKAREVLGSNFAGAWYDPADEGRLHLAVTQAAAASDVQAALTAFSGSAAVNDVRIERRTVSYAALDAAHERADTALAWALRAGQLTTYVDDQSSSLVLRYAASASAETVSQLTKQAASLPVPVRLEASDQRDLRVQTDGCGNVSGSYIGCDPFFRGGQWIQAAGNALSCSAGFVVHTSLGTPEVLTAGHCLKKGTGQWMASSPSAGQQLLGPQSSSWQYGPGDFGVIWDQNNAYWQQAGYIYNDPSPAYQIIGVGSSVAGNPICAASGVSLGVYGHSVCGNITHNDQTIQTTDGVTLTHMREANTCNGVAGASGGPFYLNNYGYGLMSAESSGCDVFYQALSLALSGTGTALG
jgi:streptogrisin C